MRLHNRTVTLMRRLVMAGVMAATLAGIGAAPALADDWGWRGDGWRHEQWRREAWREHEWRERHFFPHYYYPRYYYPPVYYYPAPYYPGAVVSIY